jgi:hypothetical protein
LGLRVKQKFHARKLLAVSLEHDKGKIGIPQDAYQRICRENPCMPKGDPHRGYYQCANTLAGNLWLSPKCHGMRKQAKGPGA